jgi:hypothetical protein
VAIQLYPLSAFRAANKAAEAVYTSIRQSGHQKDVIELMQTRAELYDRIGYHAFEQKLDALFAAKKYPPRTPVRPGTPCPPPDTRPRPCQIGLLSRGITPCLKPTATMSPNVPSRACRPWR